jgi:preprotein translocase subunit SecE
VVIVAKPQTRRSAAVAERRAAAAATKATPARRTIPRPSLPAAAAGQIEGRARGITTWFRDIRSELRKVVWPTRQEATKLTAVVIALSVVVGIFLGAVDFVFSSLVKWFLQ